MGAIIGIIFGFLFGFGIFVLPFALSIIGKIKAYKKMGFSWWASLIPIYNRYVLFKMYYGKGWKLIYEFIPFYCYYIKIVLGIRIAKSFGQDGGFGWGIGLCGILFGRFLDSQNLNLAVLPEMLCHHG